MSTLTADMLENPSVEKFEIAVHALRDLVESAGWKLYCDVIAAQKQTRLEGVMLQPTAGQDGVLMQEYMKGEYQAFAVCQTLPGLMLEDMTEQLSELRRQRDENPEGDQE